MTDDLPAPSPLPAEPKPLPDRSSDEDLIADFFRGKTENTIQAYQRDICDFAVFLGIIDEVPRKNHAWVADVDEARKEVVGHVMQRLYRTDNGRAINSHVEQYMEWLAVDHGEENPPKAPATINRRVSALKSLASLGRKIDAIYWTIEVDRKKVESYRDTSGPTLEQYKSMLKEVYPPKDEKEVRDYAMLRLAYVCALRRNELVTLDCKHVDPEQGKVDVNRKGKDDRVTMSLPDGVCDWLAILIEQNGGEGPLFQAYDAIDGHTGKRLTGDGVYHIVGRISERSGVGRVHPHGLRHAAITHYLDKTDGDIRGAQALSGHEKLETVQIYDDNRRDKAGQARTTLDEEIEEMG